MLKGEVKSEQFNDCSDRFKGKAYSLSTQKAHYPCKTNCLYQFTDFERFADRTVSSLWKAWVQVRRGSRSRPQILSFRQLCWTKAGTGLCTSKASERSEAILKKLPKGKTNVRRDLQYQSRIFTTEKRVVKNRNVYLCRFLYTHRYQGHRSFSKQYAPSLLGRSSQRNTFLGGQ